MHKTGEMELGIEIAPEGRYINRKRDYTEVKLQRSGI